jgi:hypothetical protein
VKFKNEIVRVLDISPNKKLAWIGMSVHVSKLKKVM